MSLTRRLWFYFPFIALLSLGVAGLGTAAVLIVQDGQLVGALGVDVAGDVYDVDFVDDTCVNLFDGCDSDEDFVFHNQFSNSDDAEVAGLALLEQVFLDGPSGAFDTEPTLLFGCETPNSRGQCLIAIPFNFDIQQRPSGGDVPRVQFQETWNDVEETPDGTGNGDRLSPFTGQQDPSVDTSDNPQLVWAKFTPAGEPQPPAVPSIGATGATGLVAVVIATGALFARPRYKSVRRTGYPVIFYWE